MTVAAALPPIAACYLQRQQTVFINGGWQAGRASSQVQAINPSTGRVFADFFPAALDQVGEAAAAAVRAFPAWRDLSGGARARYLRAIADGLKARKDDLVGLQMLNNGKPRLESEIDIDDAAATFHYYAELAQGLDTSDPKVVALADPSLAGQSFMKPLGPVALIVPWNFPLVTTAWKLAPALAIGCTAVLKPSEFTTLAELVYGDIAIEVGLPAGVLNIVPGGSEIGAALCSEPRFRKISFTGSNTTGRLVMAAAAQRTVPVSLELGGKSPIVILDDADIEQAAALATAGIFFNCGQMCSATSRLLVADSIADDLIAALLKKVSGIALGESDGSAVEMGPLTTGAQHKKVAAYFEKASSDRLHLLTGGNALNERDGFFVEPTIYLDVPNDHAIWREEIFGPVLCITRYAGLDEACIQANDTEFGLAAAVVGADLDRAHAVAGMIEAGHVWVNTPQVIFPNTAWGGFKNSGIGRELGPWGLSAYSAVKHVTAPLCRF